MQKIIFILILLFIFELSLSAPSCQEGANLCLRCHPITKLCIQCEKDIYVPDENGGCEYAKKCVEGNHHCSECSEDGKLCKKCEPSYYPDENGACAYTNNCEISYEGKCLKCKEDFILIGKNEYYYSYEELKICKSLNSEDLKNCEKIDTERGMCQTCKSGYYLSNNDRKCTLTENCYESTFGVCRKCTNGFYLDKKEQKCKKQEGAFEHCRETLDGKTCDVCDDEFYFDEEGICCGTNYCAVRGQYYRCEKCINGYYLSSYGDCCTPEKNCYYGNKDLGICQQCDDDYCLDYKDGHCKYNLENNDLKYCKIADGVCTQCEVGYYLGKDDKCSVSDHCSESDSGICLVCQDNYFLGLDKICINIEHCIYSNYGECTECENNYYYNKRGKNCKIAEGKFENCKYGNENDKCERCKDDFYLSRKDYLCYSNSAEGPFYKCAYTDSKEEVCTQCIDDYYLGYWDDKCTTIEGCDRSENENKCLECDEYYALNMKDNRCYPNDEINDESQKYYFNCNRTNAEGTKCAICMEGYVLNNDGLCIDNENCAYKEGGKCKKCKDEEGTFCLNDIFGCIEIYYDNCLECNDLLDFDNCTKCEDGYELNDGSCYEL